MAFMRVKKAKTKPCMNCGGMGLIPKNGSPGNWDGCKKCDGKGFHEVKK